MEPLALGAVVLRGLLLVEGFQHGADRGGTLGGVVRGSRAKGRLSSAKQVKLAVAPSSAFVVFLGGEQVRRPRTGQLHVQFGVRGCLVRDRGAVKVTLSAASNAR